MKLLLVQGDARMHIGTLAREDREYVFTYTDEFIARDDLLPVGEFPRKGAEYRSPTLWTFFEVRLPPSERADVKAAIEELRLDPNDPFQLLGKLAGKTVASPYELVVEPA